jgi:lysophospholipase
MSRPRLTHLLSVLLLALSGCGSDESVIPSFDDVTSGRSAYTGLLPLAKTALIGAEILAQNGYGSFQGKDDVKIAYAVLRVPNEQGAIVILPGRTEAYMKYFETLHDLKDLGYSFYLMDHRGQGLSGRMVADTQKGYVKEFHDYVADVKTFIDTVVTPNSSGQPIILSHSMGGAIATAYLEDYADVKAAVLVSPMHQMDTGKYPEVVAQTLAEGATLIGKGDNYALGQAGYDENLAFANNDVTHDEGRWIMNRELAKMNPSIKLGGATYRWVKEGIEADWSMRWWAGSISCPVLLLQAGQDKVVKVGAQDTVCGRADSCKKVAFAGAYHEILQEQDAIRDPALNAIKNFIQNQ